MDSRVWRAACLLLGIFAGNDRGFAGGFDRFDQGIDLLFDPGKQVVDAALIYSMPRRRYDSVNGIPEKVEFGVNKLRPSINFKFTPLDDAACLAHYREPFGTESDYGSNWSQAAFDVSNWLNVDEFGLTCSYRIPAASGYMRIIGGVTRDFARAHEDVRVGEVSPTVDLEGWATGWRTGLAYELPTKGVRASLMYYSSIDFEASGTFYQLPSGGNILAAVPVDAAASMPQAVEMVLQFPLAKSWVNTAFVKWADWSVWTQVPVILSEDASGLQAGAVLSNLDFFFRDGWTITNTVSYLWSADLTLSVRASWDRGVSTGWTQYTDSWGANLAATYKIDKTLEVYGAVGLTLLTPGEIDKKDEGGDYNATLPTDYAVGLRTGVRKRF
jgi:long-chain fatty acid transport protein